MYVVVVGMGEVGRHVVRILDREGHQVVAVDRDEGALAEIEEDHDVATLLGYGASPILLRKAGADRADLLVAVTDDDEANLIAALAGKSLGSKRSIARLQGVEFSQGGRGVQHDFLGIDVAINPRILVAREIARIARSHGALEVLGLAGNRVELVQVELPASSRVLHKALANLGMPADTLVAAVVRNGELFVPGGADVLLPGDRAYLIGHAGHMDRVADMFGGGRDAARVCIVGGGVIGATLARSLTSSDIEVLLFERRRDRAELLAAQLPRTTVLHGDGTDMGLLEEEQAGAYDLFCAVTNDDEVNLMAGLLAKRSGAPRVVSVVHRPDYMDIYRQLGIDIVLSPRLVASEQILRYVRQTALKSLTILENGQAEVLEMAAEEGTRVVGIPLQRLNVPRGAILATILSGGQVKIPGGRDRVKAGDTVVILTTAAARPAVERLFKKRLL